MKTRGLWVVILLLMAACTQPEGPEYIYVEREAVEQAVMPEPEAVIENAPEPVAEPEVAEPLPESEPEPEPLPEWWIEGGKLWRSADGVTARVVSEGRDYWFTDGGGAYRVWATHIQYGPGEEAYFLWLGEYRVTATGYEIITPVDSAETGGEAWSVKDGVISAGGMRFTVSAAGFGEAL
jgi:hypothetical protein